MLNDLYFERGIVGRVMGQGLTAKNAGGISSYDDLFRDSLSYFPAAGFEITWQTFDLHKNEPDWNLRTEHEGMFSEQGIPIKALIARKGPDSSVTWVEPKALARQQEAEDESD